MSYISQRAFFRNDHAAHIMYSDHETVEYRRAKMFNFSVGGMSFEADKALRPGVNIHIKMTEASLGAWPEDCEYYMAEVRWCEEKEGSDTPSYAVGVRFILDKCRQCGEKITYTDINHIELCSDCNEKIEELSDDKIKHCFSNYLLGNVL